MEVHRTHVEKVMDLLIYMLKAYSPDGIDLYFTSKRAKVTTAGKTKDMLRSLKSTVPIGRCNMEDRIGSILEDRLAKSNHTGLSRRPWSPAVLAKVPRRLNLYILTDGVWQPNNEPLQAIIPLLKPLKQQHLPRNHIGIQFIRFGKDPEGMRRFQQLDELDIIDTEPANGNVWKMLLGAVNHWFDDNPDDDGDDNEGILNGNKSLCKVP